MNPRYQQWIEKFHRTHGVLVPTGLYSVGGRCFQATRLMVEIFPELDRVEGEVEIGGEVTSHAWCVLKETGEIVDPTLSQFYEPLGVHANGTPIRYLKA